MRRALALIAVPALAGCAALPMLAPPGAALPESEIAAGLKEALALGSERAVGRLGRPDGFWEDARLRIPLPDSLAKAEKALRRLGQDRLVDEFHLSLNRAAERAVPEAAGIFAGAIRELTWADARAIRTGGDDAATAYFRARTAPALSARFRPIVSKVTSTSGVTRRYKDVMAKAARFTGSGGAAPDLDAYITERALASLFTVLAEEERRIRDDPAARSSELLRRVFGAT